MAKKGIALLLVFLMLVSLLGCGDKADSSSATADKPSGDANTTAAEAEGSNKDKDARIGELKEIVQEFIDAESYNFTYDEQRKAYYGEFSLESKFIKNCSVGIYLYEDMVSVSCEPMEWNVPEETRANMAIFTTLVNYDAHYAFLLMDYSDGFVTSFSSHVVEKALPTKDEIDTLVHMAIFTLEDHADSLHAVAMEKADPQETYKKLKEKRKE